MKTKKEIYATRALEIGIAFSFFLRGDFIICKPNDMDWIFPKFFFFNNSRANIYADFFRL